MQSPKDLVLCSRLEQSILMGAFLYIYMCVTRTRHICDLCLRQPAGIGPLATSKCISI